MSLDLHQLIQDGLLFDDRGQFQEAQECWKEAATLLEKDSPDSLELADVYSCLGGSYYKESRLIKALWYYEKALSIKERKAPDSLDLAGTYHTLGGLVQEPSQKVRYYEKELSIREQKDPDSLDLAETYHNLGDAYSSLSRLDKAVEYYKKALSIKEWAADVCGIGNNEEAFEYHNMYLIAMGIRRPGNRTSIADIIWHQAITKLGATRTKLRNAILANGAMEPVEVPLNYIDIVINTKKEIGRGHFGTVFEGYDGAIKANFAIEVIHKHLLNHPWITHHDTEHARKTVWQEIEALRQFHHPHIANLFGYHMSDDYSNVSLLYELAKEGSLAKIWANDLERSHLSWKERLFVALDVATALSYLHNGGDGNKACYHGDVTSANIFLNGNFQAQLYDCGLAFFNVTDDLAPTASYASEKVGTPGYICPLYQSNAIPYGPKCDVFSFGVVLMELIVGRLQNYRETPISKPKNLAVHYVMNRHQNRIEDDVDAVTEEWEPDVVTQLSDLALQCMNMRNEKERPSMLKVVKKLQMMVTTYCRPHIDLLSNHDHSMDVMTTTTTLVGGICRMCMMQSDSCLPCNRVTGSPHLHCKICLDRHLHNKLGLYEVRCPMEGWCNSVPFTDDQLCIFDLWTRHVIMRNNNEFFDAVRAGRGLRYA